MKSIVLSSVVTALLVFSGCSDKEPVVEEKVKQEVVKEVEAVKTETVSSEQSMISETSSMSMADLEGKLFSVHFDFDKFEVTPEMEEQVNMNSTIAKSEAAKFNIKLEGNCDEWGSDEYNFALGLKRANSIKKALVAEGVEAEKITMVSYGESNPTCSEKTQDCWAKNRRVDFTLLP